MHQIDLILTLTGGLGAALVFGYVTQRLGLSPIVGYLVAGIAVGPHTPGFVANATLAEQLAEIGVVLLMFGVGLQFHIEDLLAVRRVAIPGAVAQSAVATLLGWWVGTMFGWDTSAGVTFGLAISVASTVVLVRVLSDNNDLHTPGGHIAVGWLVVEDIFTVLVLVMLPALVGGNGSVLFAGGTALLKIAVLAAITVLVGGRVVPRVLEHVSATSSRELFTLTVLFVALGIAVASAEAFGVSMALGAFLAGMIVGRSDFSFRAASEALPMRDAFAVLFFVSVGMLFDWRAVREVPGLLAATIGIIMLGKPVAALAIVTLFGYPLRVALGVAVALAQIGEFSFILANVGRQLGILDVQAGNVLVAGAIVSITLNPVLYRLIGIVEHRATRYPWLARLFAGRSIPAGDAAAPAAGKSVAIIIGHGPVGRTVCRLLREVDMAPVVIEMNLETVRALKEQGITAIYGDATRPEALEQAGVANAVGLILSSAGMAGSREVIRAAKERNPGIRVLARAAHLREAAALRDAGADVVFSGEAEVGLTMTEYLLRSQGATAEQIDRERQRVRRELYEGAAPDGAPFSEGRARA